MGDTKIALNENAIIESIAFYNIFEYLYNKYYKPGTELNLLDGSKFAMYSLPYVINGSFACEIALKSAMSEDKAKKYKHNICDLYIKGDIPIACKDEIKKSIIGMGVSEDAFSTTLSEAAKLFEQWRYYYEVGREATIPNNFGLLVKAICLTMFKFSRLQIQEGSPHET